MCTFQVTISFQDINFIIKSEFRWLEMRRKRQLSFDENNFLEKKKTWTICRVFLRENVPNMLTVGDTRDTHE